MLRSQDSLLSWRKILNSKDVVPVGSRLVMADISIDISVLDQLAKSK